MSSNSLHMILSRDNYQEYFLLYVDGELNAEQCDAVEQFAAAHPDLQEELDLLLTTKLDAEPVIFPDKESLLADNMKASVIDESLLLYIDDELDGAAKESVEQQISSSSEYRFQYQLLQKTKLDKTEQVIYPNKDELYRRAEKKPAYWWQVAAAVTILLGWSIFSYMDTSEPGTQDPVVAVNKQTEVKTPQPEENRQPEALTRPASEETPATSAHIEEPPGNIAISAGRKKTSVPADASKEGSQVLPIRSSAADYATASADLPPVITTDLDVVPARVETVRATPQQNINTPAVTTRTAQPYDIVEASNASGLQETAARDDNDKKGSLRGFLRKTTRFIERRTGIDPTNGDDELMIGAVAIKL